ncbi:MAG: RsmB/NOP family class I SAM-dependent RNA methyltransferase [Thermoflexales bacterium]|nr:RsmB/NOP family class I SAM-dependent RNA methyltransferase [Thermoflexales bacterium]
MDGLPPVFLERMSELLGDEFPAFLASYTQPARAGLRLNRLRIANCELRIASELQVSSWEKVPWCESGYLVPPGTEADLARHPYHAAGVYYLQEPSAMAPAEILDPQPGETVLDLCAAPGGKSTHIAALMGNRGLLVANDTHGRRARALAMNLERCGVTCAVVLNETPQRLAARWPGGFDRVLVDAPCSGQGMFRKSKPARAEWQPGRVRTDAARQADILNAAAQLARPGGLVVYSTCTFEPDENEAVVARFLQHHAGFDLEVVEPADGFAPGRPEWTSDGNPALIKTVRLWPHLSPGEGHFVARLRREGIPSFKSKFLGDPAQAAYTLTPALPLQGGGGRSADPPAASLFQAFCDEYMQKPGSWQKLGFLTQAGAELYLQPPGTPELSGLRVVRWGWWVGTLKGKVFVPGHALGMGLAAAGVRQTLALAPDDPRLAAYLRGESLRIPGLPGWVLVTVDGFPLGWGKRAGDMLKNRRPPGLALSQLTVTNP